jgi:hypothetical protein
MRSTGESPSLKTSKKKALFTHAMATEAAAPAATQEDEAKQPDIIWEGTDEYFNQELADSIDKRVEDRKSAPSRTDPEAPAFDEQDRYIPLVSEKKEKGKKEKSVANNEVLLFEESPLSEKAERNLNILLNILTKGSSRLAVQYRRGATKKDLSQYTHKHDLVKGNPGSYSSASLRFAGAMFGAAATMETFSTTPPLRTETSSKTRPCAKRYSSRRRPRR